MLRGVRKLMNHCVLVPASVLELPRLRQPPAALRRAVHACSAVISHAIIDSFCGIAGAVRVDNQSLTGAAAGLIGKRFIEIDKRSRVNS